MSNFVQFSTGYWEDTAGWPADAKLLYAWTWTGRQSYGLTGIGDARDPLVCVLTGLSQERLDVARAFLQELGKVDWRGHHFVVLERMDHALRTRTGDWASKNVENAREFLRQNELPVWLLERVRERYPDLLGAKEFESLVRIAGRREEQSPRPTNGGSMGDGRGIDGPSMGDRRGIDRSSGPPTPPHVPRSDIRDPISAPPPHASRGMKGPGL
ncbi:MAG TPA: hypothetical protein VM223_01440 [Planctomycetota bacterium]|nr:hypothetical protein [Planctomycetota bacterium]